MSHTSDKEVEFSTVHWEEVQYIQKRRQKENPKRGETKCIDKADFNLIGLALSGGGIRAATTHLGIHQALSEMGILSMVDYLSTVSGGGYIGSCLSALLSLNQKAHRGQDEYTFDPGDQALYTTEWEHFPFNENRRQKGGELGREQVEHLRTHGNFLMVRQGLFARESLRSVGNVLTGIVYHLFIVLLAFFACSALYMALVFALVPNLDKRLGKLHQTDQPERITALLEITAQGTETRMTPRKPTFWDHLTDKRNILNEDFGKFFGSFGTPQRVRFLIAFCLGVVAALAAYWYMRCIRTAYLAGWRAQSEEEAWYMRCIRTTCLAGWRAQTKTGESEEEAYEQKVLLGMAGLVLFYSLLVIFGIRLSWATTDNVLWLLLPFVTLLGTVVGLHVLSLLLPYRDVLEPKDVSAWKRDFRSLLGALQAIQLYLLVLALLFALLPFLIYTLKGYGFGAAFSAVISLAVSRLLAGKLAQPLSTTKSWPLALKKFILGVFVGLFVLLIIFMFCTILVSLTVKPACLLLWTGASFALFGLLGWLVNSNKISPHYFYRDRLTETYLRTEVRDRDGRMAPHHDNMEMPLQDLHGKSRNPTGPPWRSTAPYHLLSTAINLAGSRDLTRKDRKSGYFLFSKLYCGSEQTGYRCTKQYRQGETKLARAMTISGAAVASGMGYSTFFAQAFALTLFNIRLGYWMENPQQPKSMQRQERWVFWPWYLGREMFAKTHAQSRLVNLSDGGHTGDNIGIYPLLQRRCKIIIACDAEADNDMTFDSFTEALRHAYVDLGVNVDIDFTMLRRDPQTGRSRSHCAIGRIQYPKRPFEKYHEQNSWLIYLKNSLLGNEQEPVLNYAADHPSFPHETTSDQFFSDAQFESYRALGVHIAQYTFGEWLSSKHFKDLQGRHSPFKPDKARPDFCEDEAWKKLQFLHSPFKAADNAAFERMSDRFRELERLYMEDSELWAYYLEGSGTVSAYSSTGYKQKITNVCKLQTSLMEQTFFALQLDQYANAPDNRGWMNLFRRWGRSPTFKTHFNMIKEIYSQDFIDFYEQYLCDWPPIDEKPIPHPWDYPKPAVKGIFLDSGRREAKAP